MRSEEELNKSNSNQVGTHSEVVENGKGEDETDRQIEVDGK